MPLGESVCVCACVCPKRASGSHSESVPKGVCVCVSREGFGSSFRISPQKGVWWRCCSKGPLGGISQLAMVVDSNHVALRTASRGYLAETLVNRYRRFCHLSSCLDRWVLRSEVCLCITCSTCLCVIRSPRDGGRCLSSDDTQAP